MSIRKVEEARRRYESVVHSIKKEKKDRRLEVLKRVNDKYPEDIPKEAFENDKDVIAMKKYFNTFDDNSRDYHKLPEYKEYEALRDAEIEKRYKYKAISGFKTKESVKTIAKETGIEEPVVSVVINKFERKNNQRYQYMLKSPTGKKYYCPALDDVKDFCLSKHIDFNKVIDGEAKYKLTKIFKKTFNKLNRGASFIYEGYVYKKTSINFFVCLGSTK